MLRPTAQTSSMWRQSMQMKLYRTVARDLCGRTQGLREESPKGLVRHLARGHRELAVATLDIGMTTDRHVVGRIEECDVNRGAVADHLVQELKIAAIAAAYPVVA